MASDRDRYQPKTPPVGIRQQLAAPTPVFDDLTGRYEGAELARMRANRPTEKRLAILEAKDDERAKDVGEIKVAIVRIEGNQAVAAVTLEAIKKAVDREAEVEHAEDLDSIDARKTRRSMIAKAIGLLLSGGAIGKVLHMMGWL